MTIGCVRMMSITASPPNFPQMVSANHSVVVAAPHIVYARLELDHVVHIRSIFNGPVHSATNTTQRKSSRSVSTSQLLEHLQHPILIEAAIWKVDLGVDPEFQLAALLRSLGVDAGGRQAALMVLTLIRV